MKRNLWTTKWLLPPCSYYKISYTAHKGTPLACAGGAGGGGGGGKGLFAF